MPLLPPDAIELKLLDTALGRLQTFCDPCDGRCGVDALAREASRLYIESWILPQLKAVRALLATGAPPAHTTFTDLHQIAERRDGGAVGDKPVRDPFSKLRALYWAQDALKHMRELRGQLAQALAKADAVLNPPAEETA